MKLVALLPYLRALSQLYQHAHWKCKGDNFFGDHLLFERLYGETNGEIDAVAEKIIGLSSDPELINPDSDSTTTAKLLKEMANDDMDFATQAVNAEKGLLALIKALLPEATDGLSNLLEGIADLHEGHVYLLQQRKTSMSALAGLYKMAYVLDKEGLYAEANEIDEAMKVMSQRAGLSLKDMVSLADYFDECGETALASQFDTWAVSKKKV